MTREKRKKIKDWIYNVLIMVQNQEEFKADDSGLDNFENSMFDDALYYILGHKMRIK